MQHNTLAARLLVLALLLSCQTAFGQEEFGVVPRPGQDHSALRVDSDVYGWSRDFTEMAAMGSEIHRGPLGRHRGEVFVLVFKLGEIKPIHNVHVLWITQSDQPHDPLPIADIRSRMWAAGHSFTEMWPARPIRSHRKGAMFVDEVWDSVEVEPTVCQPAVGFMLTYQGELRYQRQALLPLRAPCKYLRHTDSRIYWGRKDIAAAMIRFDYSASKKNEKSFRYPMAVAWSLGRAVRIVLRTNLQKNHPNVRDTLRILNGFGDAVVTQVGDLQDGPPGVWSTDELASIARRLREDINGVPMEAPAALQGSPDIVVDLRAAGPSVLGTKSQKTAEKQPQTATVPQLDPNQETPKPKGVEENTVEDVYLKNWKMP